MVFFISVDKRRLTVGLIVQQVCDFPHLGIYSDISNNGCRGSVCNTASRKTILLLSPSGAFVLIAASASFSEGTDSLVSAFAAF